MDNKEIYKKTLTFSLRRFLWDLGSVIVLIIFTAAGFIVTDKFLFENGYTKVVTDKLEELGIAYTVFSNVAPDPTLACAKEGAKLMDEFDALI